MNSKFEPLKKKGGQLLITNRYAIPILLQTYDINTKLRKETSRLLLIININPLDAIVIKQFIGISALVISYYILAIAIAKSCNIRKYDKLSAQAAAAAAVR